jgi:hypothetical protein
VKEKIWEYSCNRWGEEIHPAGRIEKHRKEELIKYGWIIKDSKHFCGNGCYNRYKEEIK